ncbi:DUF6307 family protein [Mycobacterium deserti]|uniref:DUF6307 family protein n=1 Tax=Mycobacterium deserti TaxID=2978347 RepID=A0ABT2M7Y5_9MYCO|nr:DUF6307 family protein [Mycobacterium deserti]MCT7658377.1 DUF6307 family protein [Mycobacterium deserti]
MTSAQTFRTPYDDRIDVVQRVISSHSDLDDVAAGDLAVHVLHALNSIPEKVR